MDDIAPLSTPQQRFLQRLLASHVVNDRNLQEIWDEIKEESSSNNEPLGRNLNDTLGIINRSLKPAFGLEIRSVSLALNLGEDKDDEDEDEAEEDDTPTLYHTIINCQGDDVSKAAANPEMTKNPHELALFRLIIESLVEMSSNEDDDGDDENDGSARKKRKRNRRGMGCQASVSRMDMINMRTKLTGAHAGTLTVTQVENAIHLFVSQGWFVQAANPNGRSKKAAKKRNSMGGSRFLQLGPRSYMEFPEFLELVGLDKDLLPQFLIHG